LQTAEIRRSADRAEEDLTGYDLYLRARADAESWERPRLLSALDLLGRVLERDPQYGPALALAAMCCSNLQMSGWADDLAASRREGVEFARRALRVAGDDPYILANAAFALGHFGEDIDAALSLIDRSLQLNPSFARAWLRSGWLRLWVGQVDAAIEHFETFIFLSPRESRAAAFLGIGVGHFFCRHFAQAQAMLLSSLQEIPGWVPTHRFLAACYAHMGQLDKAREMVERLREITAELVPSAAHWRLPEHRELYLSGLRLALGEPL
jgi:adenylate cyclase